MLSLIIVFCLKALIVKAEGRKLSPVDFGLYEAKNGIERYNCLYRTHCAAIETGLDVSYSGIDSLDIEISKDAKSIPLTEETDFCGMVLRVTNNAKGHFVFELSQKTNELSVDKTKLDTGNFSDIPCLASGQVVLILEDKNPWVKNRHGYQYGAIRKDIVFLENGIAQNRSVAKYNTEETSPDVHYFFVSTRQKKVSNIKFVRQPENTMRAYFVRISNQCGMELSNIVCETPINNLFYDQMICVKDCANIIFKNITINGTYSQDKKSGYGISMNNVYNVSFYNLRAHAKWGVFGNNNVNNIKLYNCDINRFDVHCYGRDIYFYRCIFRNLYNQFSSIFGTISFLECEFINFTPVLFEPSYNAYTKFDLMFKNCVIHSCKEKDYLISAGELTGCKTNERDEISKQQYPNLYIDGLRIDMSDELDVYYIYKFRNNILTFPNIEGIKKIRSVKFSKRRCKLEPIDTRNQRVILSLGCLTLFGVGFTIYSLYVDRLKKRRSA